MKNKIAKIIMVLALVVLAPISVILTGCGQETEPLKLASTNRVEFYLGETFEDTNWKADYFDGETTTTINITADMVTGFSTSAVNENLTATITYKDITKTLNYSVKATPFNTSVVYRCPIINEESTQYAYLRFALDGSSAKIIVLSEENNTLTITSDIWETPVGPTVTELTFSTFRFVNNKWTVTSQTSPMEGCTVLATMTKTAEGQVTLDAVQTTSEGSASQPTMNFRAM